MSDEIDVAEINRLSKVAWTQDRAIERILAERDTELAAAEARGEARGRADLAKLWDATGIPRDADRDVDFVAGAILQMVDRSRQHRTEVARLYREIADAEARGRRWAVQALRRLDEGMLADILEGLIVTEEDR